MTAFQWCIVGTIITSPLLAYFIAKFGTAGYLRAKLRVTRKT